MLKIDTPKAVFSGTIILIIRLCRLKLYEMNVQIFAKSQDVLIKIDISGKSGIYVMNRCSKKKAGREKLSGS